MLRHPRTRSLLLLAALGTLLQVRVLQAQEGWAIVGEVQTIRGELPDRPILVTLQFRGGPIATTYSDSEGKFSFSDLMVNAYHVVINDEKFRPVDQIVEINPMNTAPTRVHISLTPKEAPAPDLPSPGRNPNMVNSVEFTKQIPKAAVKEFEKGTKCDKDGKNDDAIAHYEKAIKLAPEFYAARNNLGSDYLGKSQFAPAQEQFDAVIKINPSDATAYFNLGNLYLLQQSHDQASHWLELGLTKDPNSALGHFLLGSVYTRTGKLEPAEKELQASLQLDPKLAKARLALVNIYLQQQRSTDAIAELRQFLKAAPNDSFAPRARDVLKRLEAQTATNAERH